MINVKDKVVDIPKLLPLNENRYMKCKYHNEPIKMYCETCEELICQHCTISKCHRKHKCKLITECYHKHHQEIQTNLATVKNKVADVNTALTNLMSEQREIIQQGDNIKNDICAQAQLIINLVKQSERQLVEQVDATVQQKIQVLAKQREEVEIVLNQLKSCEEFAEQSLKVGSELQVLGEKRNMVQVMTKVNQDVDLDAFQPAEKANITFTRYQKYDGIGELKSKTFGKSVLFKNACYVHNKSTITLNMQTYDGSPFSIPLSLMSCQLLSVDSSEPIACDINDNQSSNYDIRFTPHTTGKHQLIVRLDVDITDTPVFLHVIPSPEMTVSTIPNLNKPRGVVITKGEIIVAERDSHCITVLNMKGQKLRSFGTKGTQYGQFTNPRGVAISHDGHVLVTDEHRLQKLTYDGVCIASVGNKIGKAPLQFDTPAGITVHPTTGQIFIADTNNRRIQVLNNDLTYSHSFGNKGSALEQFNLLRDVMFDSKGYLYVVDNTIKKFTPTGQYISTFSSEGSNLKDPTSIAIGNNLVYVTQWGNRILVFDTNGCFVDSFGKSGSKEGEFNRPCDITVDSLGNLYISDTFNNRLVVL